MLSIERLPQLPASIGPESLGQFQVMLPLPAPPISRLPLLPPLSHPHPSPRCSVTPLSGLRGTPPPRASMCLHVPYIYHHAWLLRWGCHDSEEHY